MLTKKNATMTNPFEFKKTTHHILREYENNSTHLLHINTGRNVILKIDKHAIDLTDQSSKSLIVPHFLLECRKLLYKGNGQLILAGGLYKNKFVIYDIFEFNGMSTCNFTLLERIDLLKELYSPEPSHTYFLRINENIVMAEFYHDNFTNHYKEIKRYNNSICRVCIREKRKSISDTKIFWEIKF